MKSRGLTAAILLATCLVWFAPAPAETAPAATRKLINVDGEGLAVRGYDVVAYFTEGRPVKGDERYRVAFGGATYQFASAEHQALFEKEPERYVPSFGGYCAYAASIDRVAPIDPELWEIVEGRLILQYNRKAWNLWHEDPAGRLAKAKANWPGLVERHGR